MANEKRSLEEIGDFLKRYHDPKHVKNQRLGQAFCNEFNIQDHKLFYEKDDYSAIQYIWQNHWRDWTALVT